MSAEVLIATPCKFTGGAGRNEFPHIAGRKQGGVTTNSGWKGGTPPDTAAPSLPFPWLCTPVAQFLPARDVVHHGTPGHRHRACGRAVLLGWCRAPWLRAGGAEPFARSVAKGNVNWRSGTRIASHVPRTKHVFHIESAHSRRHVPKVRPW